MLTTPFRPYTIVCASLAHLSDETNAARDWLVESYLKQQRLPFKRTVGHYCGDFERGFIIFGRDREHAAITVARALQQETYFHATAQDAAMLVGFVRDGRLGMQHFTRCEPCGADEPFWTRIGDGKRFVWR